MPVAVNVPSLPGLSIARPPPAMDVRETKAGRTSGPPPSILMEPFTARPTPNSNRIPSMDASFTSMDWTAILADGPLGPTEKPLV